MSGYQVRRPMRCHSDGQPHPPPHRTHSLGRHSLGQLRRASERARLFGNVSMQSTSGCGRVAWVVGGRQQRPSGFCASARPPNRAPWTRPLFFLLSFNLASFPRFLARPGRHGRAAVERVLRAPGPDPRRRRRSQGPYGPLFSFLGSWGKQRTAAEEPSKSPGPWWAGRNSLGTHSTRRPVPPLPPPLKKSRGSRAAAAPAAHLYSRGSAFFFR